MKKTLLFYVIMLFAIAFLATIENLNLYGFIFINFSHQLHMVFETAISILLFSIFWNSNKLYLKTKDERFQIIGYGFLLGLIFNLVHVFSVNTFPYDNLAYANFAQNPTLSYLLIGYLIISGSIYFAVIHKTQLNTDKQNLKIKYTNVYLYTFVILATLPLIIYYVFPQLLTRAYILMHTLEYINYALYLIIAAIIINARINYNKAIFNKFISGLLVLGLGCLFYINPQSLPINGILGHIFQILGFALILSGLPELIDISNSLRVRDLQFADLSLLLVIFYIIFVAGITSIFKIIVPQFSGYIFIELLLIFQLILNIFSTESWNRIAKVYIASEKNKTLINIFESMRRISNPNIIKNTIISEIKEHFHPDNCFIAIYDPKNNNFYYDRYAEYLPSRTLLGTEDIDKNALDFENFQDVFNNININFQNIDKYIADCSLNGTQQEKVLKDYKIKSLYSIPINYKDTFVGYLILQYKFDYKTFNNEEIEFLNKIATQIGIAMNK